jgi:hypothetical protein
VAECVPYPWTVEVYGGAGYSKLQPGGWRGCNGDALLVERASPMGTDCAAAYSILIMCQATWP